MNGPAPCDGGTFWASQAFPNPYARVEFYNRFKHEADKRDNDSVNKYDRMFTTLFFGCLISVITSIFIIDVQRQFRPDYTQANHAFLTVVPSASFSQWTGPDPTVIRVQVMLYWGLVISLLAVFTTILGGRWLNQYSQAKLRGSVVRRDRRQPPAFDVTWHFDLVMECLSLMPQVSLLLLVYALSEYLFFVDEVVTGVVVGLPAFSLLHFLVTSTTVLPYNFSPRAPFSLILRSLAHFYEELRKGLQRPRQRFGKQSQSNSCGPFAPNSPDTSDEKHIGDRLGLTMAGPPDRQPPWLTWGTDWSGHVLDANCILLE